MVYRLTWIGIGAGLLISLFRMEDLLRSATSGPAWQLVLVAALLLGAVITWVSKSYRISSVGVVAANVVGMALATIRIAAPETAFLGILPTWSTFSETGRELSFALDLIRFGTAPIVPVAGLILILTWVFWVIGMLVVWGLHAHRPAIAVVPGIVLYLQLATMDRSPTNSWATVAYLGLVVGTLAAIAHDERTVGSGRVRASDRRFMRGGTATAPIAVVALVLILGVGATVFVSDRATDAGVLTWRSTGFGNGLFGGVSFNHFVGIQQSLVNLSDDPVFTASVQGAPQEETLYWKLIALEEFDGANWYQRPSVSSRPPVTGNWEIGDQTFIGPTSEINSTITIDRLRENYLPAPYTPTGLASDFDILVESYRIRPDGALKFGARSFPGLQYQVTSQVPQLALGVLASNNGRLSPMFAQAARDGLFTPAFESPPGNRNFEAREDLLDTSALDDEDERLLEGLAQFITANATTNFERAVLLEDFFRDSEIFTYNAQVALGHSAQSIVGWLLEQDSPNYREGYCEQFAASMAIMARTLNIPARVILGFAPGDVAADGTVTVRENDAHSWVELWFNTQGWVRFDPTPRSAADNPPLSAALGFDPSDIVFQETDTQLQPGDPGFIDVDPSLVDLELLLSFLEDRPTGFTPRPTPAAGAQTNGIWRWIVLVTLAILSSVPPALRWWRRKRRIDRMRTGDITAAWQEIVDELEDLGEPVLASATPVEAAERVSPVMSDFAEAYQAQVYGPNADLAEPVIRAARASFGLTHRHLQDSHPPPRHLFRWLRIGSLRRK